MKKFALSLCILPIFVWILFTAGVSSSQTASDEDPLCLIPLVIEGKLDKELTDFRKNISEYKQSEVIIEQRLNDEKKFYFRGIVVGEFHILTVAHGADLDLDDAQYEVFLKGNRRMASIGVVRNKNLGLALLTMADSLYAAGGLKSASFNASHLKNCDPIFMLEKNGFESARYSNDDNGLKERNSEIYSFSGTIVPITLRLRDGLSGAGIYRDGLVGIFDAYNNSIPRLGFFIPLEQILKFLKENLPTHDALF